MATKTAANAKARAKRRATKTKIDPKTGRRVRKDPKRVAAARKGAKKRIGKKVSATTKRKIAVAVKKTLKKGRTKTGRKVVKRKTVKRTRKA